MTKPHATCPTGRADAAECALLGRPVPSLIEVSRHPAAPVDRCQGRCAAMMSVPSTWRQGLVQRFCFLLPCLHRVRPI
jgi:hypothetical protein